MAGLLFSQSRSEKLNLKGPGNVQILGVLFRFGLVCGGGRGKHSIPVRSLPLIAFFFFFVIFGLDARRLSRGNEVAHAGEKERGTLAAL